MGISVDTIADNAAMVEKLILPFSLLSDSRGLLLRRFGVWDSKGRIAIPGIAVVAQNGTLTYLYSGHDFADRPEDAAIFEALDRGGEDGVHLDGEPEIRVTTEEARQSVGPDRPAITLGDLVPYYRGAFFASVALKGRLAALGERGQEGVAEISSYQSMVREYLDALTATAKLVSSSDD